MAKFKKKPTIKEVANVTIELNKRVNELYNILRDLDNLFGQYVRMNGNMDEFNKYVSEKLSEFKEKQEKENDSKGNEESDTVNIQVLMVYLLKHIDGISSFVNGHKSQREDVRGRITDAIVYLCLLWGMIEDTESNKKND